MFVALFIAVAIAFVLSLLVCGYLAYVAEGFGDRKGAVLLAILGPIVLTLIPTLLGLAIIGIISGIRAIG